MQAPLPPLLPEQALITEQQRRRSLSCQNPLPATLAVYAVTGQQVINRRLAEGITAIPLPQGIYIVTLDKLTRKVVIKE